MNPTKWPDMDTWFEAQFGPRPDPRESYEIWEECYKLKQRAKEIARLADACDLWDARWQAARYAWTLWQDA